MRLKYPIPFQMRFRVFQMLILHFHIYGIEIQGDRIPNVLVGNIDFSGNDSVQNRQDQIYAHNKNGITHQLSEGFFRRYSIDELRCEIERRIRRNDGNQGAQRFIQDYVPVGRIKQLIPSADCLEFAFYLMKRRHS